MFTRRLTSFAALMLISLLATSCGNKSTGNSTPENGDLSYKDQVTQGKIAGHDWLFSAGRLTEPSSSSIDPNKWAFTLVANEIENICSDFLLTSEDQLKVIFSLKPEVGNTNLGIGSDGQTITLVEAKTDTSQNNVLTEGSIELIAVDAGSVRGRVAASMDEDNFINGNFSLTRCCNKAEDSFSYEVCL